MKSFISFSTIWNILSFVTIIILIVLYVTEVNKQKDDKIIPIPEPKEVDEDKNIPLSSIDDDKNTLVQQSEVVNDDTFSTENDDIIDFRRRRETDTKMSYMPGEVWTDYISKPILKRKYSTYEISVLMPIRGIRFIRSLKKLMEYSSKPERIQIVLRCDDDDDTIQLEHFKDIHSNISVVTGPRLRGYDSAHIMYTEMINVCMGKVLMMWNDDANIMTKNWDEIIYPLLLKKEDDYHIWQMKVKDEGPLFPIISRNIVEKTQCYSGHYTNDTFLKDVWNVLGREIEYIDIHLRHENDKTFVGKGIPKDIFSYHDKKTNICIDSVSYEEAIQRFVEALKI